MIKCSFCLVSAKPNELTDCELEPNKNCLENLCYSCYETHKKAHELDKDNNIINRMLDSWKLGKCHKVKGNNSIL